MNSPSNNIFVDDRITSTDRPQLIDIRQSEAIDAVPNANAVTPRHTVADRVLSAVNALHRQTFFLINDDLTIDWISNGIISLLGRTPESIVGTSALALIHPEDMETVAEVIAQDFNPGARSRDLGHRPTMDVRVAHANGDWLSLTVHSTMRLDDENIRALIVQVYPRDQLRDISDGVIAATQGAPLNECLMKLIRSVGLGASDDPRAVILDTEGQVLAQTPGSRCTSGDAYGIIAWTLGSGCSWSSPILSPQTGERLGSVVTAIPLTFAPPFDRRTVADVAAHAGVLMERERSHASLHRAATTDALTGVYNRSSFMRELMEPHWSSTDHHVVYMDLDGFKDINDSYGHRIGDEVLTVVASRLRDCVREGDLVARLGGDEFAVILSTEASASDVLERLRFAVTDQMISVDGHLVEVNASFGIARPQGDPLKTLEAADRSMYLDKIKRRAKRAS